MLYNATLMWLLALLWKLEPLGANSRIESCALAATPLDADTRYSSFEPLRRPGAAVAVRDPAMEVCHVFEWITRHHNRSKEPTFLYLFPVGMAMSVLESDAEDYAWVKSLLGQSPITANYSKGQNPAGFGFYVTPEALHPETIQAKQQLFSTGDINHLSRE